MRGRWLCRIGAGILFVMAAWLFAEHKLGRPLLIDEGPDPTSLTTSLFLMLLGLWLLGCGEVGALRERIRRLEQSAQGPGSSTEPASAGQ